MCVDAMVRSSRWADPDDAVLATTHRLPVLIAASSDKAVANAAREIHVASFTRPAPLVTFRASGFFQQPQPFAAQWRALCDAARDGSVLITAIEEMSYAAQVLLLDALTAARTSRSPRLIAGTTVALVDRLGTGEFSEELFYRLNAFYLEVRDDIGEAAY